MLVFQGSPRAENNLSQIILSMVGSKQPFEKAVTESDSVYTEVAKKKKHQCKILVQTTEFKINYISRVSGFKSYE